MDLGPVIEVVLRQQSNFGKSGMLVSDSAIQNCNRIILDKSSKIEAEKLWKIGKEIGVSLEGQEEGILQKFIELEARDRACIL